MILGTIIVILLIVVFIFTFVIPIASAKAAVGRTEGFQVSMSNYLTERQRMDSTGKQLYNELGVSLDPTLPSFPVTGVQYDPKLSVQQYTDKFNKTVDDANKNITIALQSPDATPSMSSPTNLALKATNVTPQLPPANDLYITALRCQAVLNKRADCSKLDDPDNALCGICIKGGTKIDGSSPNTFIGGLLSLIRDRNDAMDAAAGGTPIFQPSLGKCPPGMFYVDSASCTKAVNQLNCKEIGDTGGFTGGQTIEGNKMPQVSCVQAPIAGSDVFLYADPAAKSYPVVLRVISPFGTGITKIVVTHQQSGKTYSADNGGNPGQEFTLTLPSVQEDDTVTVLVAQETANRTSGGGSTYPEVFQTTEVVNGNSKTYSVDDGKALCKRLGANLATSVQLKNALDNGIQSANCGIVADQSNSMYASQTGSSTFKYIPIGGAPGYGGCGTGSANAVWCYGPKPAADLTNPSVAAIINTKIANWFQSYGPPQGPSTYSQYSQQGASDPPGNSKRAVIIQWEMQGSKNRTVPFMQTISMVNGFPIAPAAGSGVTSPLYLAGPFTGSSVISGPAWNSNMAMLKNQFWYWSTKYNSQTVVFTAQVPGYLHDPFYTEDIDTAPQGPLIANQATSALLKTSPCMADDQKPGSYSPACLLELYQGAGGIPGKGTLSTDNGGLSQLNGYGDLNAISTYLDGLYNAATLGKDANGNVLSYDLPTRLKAMNAAAQQLFGFDILNPCELIVDNADGSVGVVASPMSNVTVECLQYLWLNTGSDKSRMGSTGTIYDSTYVNIQDRFSGLLNTESTPARRAQYPFQTCQLTGTMAPIKNGQPDKTVINQLMSLSSLMEIQDFFNNIFQTANNFGGTFDAGTADRAAAQAKAIEQCYGFKQAKDTTLGYGCK